MQGQSNAGSTNVLLIRDLIRKRKQEAKDGGSPLEDGEDDAGEGEFEYKDSDTYVNEISELYSYSEVPEFRRNLEAYETLFGKWGIPIQWQRLTEDQRKSAILRLIDHLELCNRGLRDEAVRTLLYLVQGCWTEVQSEQEQGQWTKYNVMLLLRNGIYYILIDLLSLEINYEMNGGDVKKSVVSLADSAGIRAILIILYIIVETVRTDTSDDNVSIRMNFKYELTQPYRDEMLSIKLLNMVKRFSAGTAPHYPIKKVLLLLWKVLLFTLGGTPELVRLKNEARQAAGLAPILEDTLEISSNMRPYSPPPNVADHLNSQNEKRRPFRRGLIKQPGIDETNTSEYDISDDLDEEMKEIDDSLNLVTHSMEDEKYDQGAPPSKIVSRKKVGLPWAAKVRPKDLDDFLENSRAKFIGYFIEGDRNTLAGLPPSILEGVKVLKNHLYVPLSESQMKKEDDLLKCPLSRSSGSEEEIGNEMESLYKAMLPNLAPYLIALLKILLAASRASKNKAESEINIMSDVLPEEMPITVVQSMKLSIDVSRHKEIILKSISAILFLLLKHAKINHVYQFEFISQQLVFANCIPLILKFLNQNIRAFITAKNTIMLTDFPSCILGEQPELTAESLELGESSSYCWRNLFSCINLVRVVNKLTKWKHSRIMMLVVFKSAPILVRSLRVKSPIFQLYVLKLLKMQTKYLGRQWRKTNIRTMSAIYQKVRHRFTDDWAYGNDMDARPWDFQAEECNLRASVERFNNRRYGFAFKLLPDFEAEDPCASGARGNEQLPRIFKENYEAWLEEEVFKNPIDWDEVNLNFKGVK